MQNRAESSRAIFPASRPSRRQEVWLRHFPSLARRGSICHFRAFDLPIRTCTRWIFSRQFSGKAKARFSCRKLATSFMYTGDVHFNDLYIDRIEQVTAAQLQDVAKKYLDTQRLLTTALLPSDSAGSADLPKAVDLIRAAAPTTQKSTTQPSPGTV